MNKLCIIVFLFPFFGMSQPMVVKETQGGIFSIGLRTTASSFSGDKLSSFGTGVGGQFRIQVADRINTEWFLDYITGEVGDFASRIDYHIGWSVMYYLTKSLDPIIKPYLVIGHCFDKTMLIDNSDHRNRISKNSSAVQGGAGLHFRVSQRFDISLNTQYMMHLGDDIHTHYENARVHFESEKRKGVEGHFLMHIGLNYKIADLW
ncbi:MAG: outer membrane beta-barrel protein [Flavobacteriales bacterium]|nr:outer membrane beta-barrel protein [Flavobacteriales bacterium]